MESTHFTPRSTARSGIHQRLVQPVSCTNSAQAQPTYVEVINMISCARITLDRQYEHIPKLRNELRIQFAEAIEECRLDKRDPVTLLRSRLRMERRTFDSYNKYRLNDKGFGAQQRLAHIDEEIEEDLESFPFRLEVVERGFAELTEDLHPIYQSRAYNLHAAVEMDCPLATLRSKISRSRSKAPAPSITPSTNKTGRKVENYDKLEDAPRPNLDFPNANILIPEMAAFIPNAIKSWDVLDRTCGNGLRQFVYSIMMNHYREMARGKITVNSTYRMFKGPMSKRAKAEPNHKPSWEAWTPTIHDQYQDATNFDPSRVSVAGFRTPADGKIKTSHSPIPMKNLAIGVKVFPSGKDALDLTRMVRYCVDHPDEGWFYPTHYDRLLNMLGGPAPVTAAHTDPAVVARWTSALVATGKLCKNTGRKRDFRGRLHKEDSGSDDEKYNEIDESESEPDFDEMDETDSGSSSAKLKKDSKRKRSSYLEDSYNSDGDAFNTPSRKSSAKRNKLAVMLRTTSSPARQSGKRAICGPSRMRAELILSDIDSESDGDGYSDPKSHKKKAPLRTVRRSDRTTKFSKSFSLAEHALEDDDEELLANGETPNLLAHCSMQATKMKLAASVKELDSDLSDA